MSKIIVKQIENKNEWEGFLHQHPEGNFLHSWYWGEFHKNLGNKIHRIGFFENEILVGVMLSIVEKSKRGKFLTVPGGPIIDWSNKNLVNSVFEEIKKIAKDNKCVFARIRPQLISNDNSKLIFKNHKFTNAP